MNNDKTLKANTAFATVLAVSGAVQNSWHRNSSQSLYGGKNEN